MLHFHHIRMFHPKNYQNYFYHYYFSHFLPLHLNGERKSGKDLEMTRKCAIFVPIKQLDHNEKGRNDEVLPIL